MTALHRRIRRTIERHTLAGPSTKILVGLSGGSDSVALTFLLRELAPECGFSVVAAAHFNHRLRSTADRDERFCRDLAERLRLPILVDSADVQTYAATQRLSVEDAARRIRYDFLHRVAGEVQADRIAVGHTRDDQAETVLLKLVRGAGLTGLGGIYPRRGAVIRPVLDVSRADLQSYLYERGESWVEDETNEDLANPRNRIRRVVLPELESAYGGDVRTAISRAAGLIRDDGQYLDELSDARYAALSAASPDGMEIDAAVAAEPLPVRRRVILRAIRAVSGNREVGLEHVEAVLQVLSGAAAAFDGPGCRVELRRGKLVLFRQRGFPR